MQILMFLRNLEWEIIFTMLSVLFVYPFNVLMKSQDEPAGQD